MRSPAPISLLAVTLLFAACQGGSGDDDIVVADASLVDSGDLDGPVRSDASLGTDGPVGSDALVQEIDASSAPPIDAAEHDDAGVVVLPPSFIPCSSGQALRVFAPDDLPLSIPDANITGITSQVTVTGSGEIARAAVVIFDLQHSFVADLLISLVSPTS